MTWTHFYDMHSGGPTKEPPYEHIFIEAPHDEAVRVFYARFGHNPNRVTCTCCGEDYSISSDEDLAQLTAYRRRCLTAAPLGEHQSERYWNATPEEQRASDQAMTYFESKEEIPDGWELTYYYEQEPPIPLAEYIAREEVLIIPADTITHNERYGHEPPQEGYVWVG